MNETATAQPPASFRYFANQGSRKQRAAAQRLGRFTNGSPALPDAVVTEIGLDRTRGDALSDGYITAAFDQGWSREARKFVEQALDQGIASVKNPPPELTALFAHLDAEPDWLDWNLVEKGAKVFRRYGLDAFYYFGTISISGYRNESIFKPLVLTGAYTGGSAFGRFLETCRFWTDVSDAGGLRQRGEGRKTAVLVRVMHSMIRRRILSHPEWDAARLGVPLNQYDQFGTILLSFLLNQQTRKLGYWPGRDEVEAHMHFWRYVAHLLGVEPAFFPETIADWWRVGYTYSLSNEPADGRDAEHLSQSFLDAFGPNGSETPNVAAAKLREQRKVLGYAGFFLGPDVFKALHLTDPGRLKRRPMLHILPNLAAEAARRVVPGVAGLIDRRRSRARAEWLARHLAGRRARFTPVEELSR